MARKPEGPLRRGWTTGACATAATKAAYHALLTGQFLDPVEIRLPKGQTPGFALAIQDAGEDWRMAGIIKDAGDDPDVTHGALVKATIRRGAAGTGVTFRAGEGIGTVTRPGLQLPPGEPAINPVPRKLMREAVAELATAYGDSGDVEVEIAIPEGEELAKKTMNGRLGIIGGLSILGTTGVVIPFSCSSWIHSIHRGIDVARAEGLSHVAGATGSVSEAAVQKLYSLPEIALLDMGDFAGGLLKYLREHPITRLTLAGGFGKISKLAAGYLDLHSGRSRVDTKLLGQMMCELGAGAELAARAEAADSAAQILEMAQQADLPLADAVAERARAVAQESAGQNVAVEVIIFDRGGNLLGRSRGRSFGGG